MVYSRPLFETGVVFPRWGADAYTSSAIPIIAIGLNEIQNQTAARWVELTVDFYQPTPTSTTVGTQSTTPTPEALEAGIRTAHAHGFRVFVAPLLTVGKSIVVRPDQVHRYSGQADAWFTSYWRPTAALSGRGCLRRSGAVCHRHRDYGLEGKWTSQWNQSDQRGARGLSGHPDL